MTVGYTCASCFTAESPLWRRTVDGSNRRLCNSCGLREAAACAVECADVGHCDTHVPSNRSTAALRESSGDSCDIPLADDVHRDAQSCRRQRTPLRSEECVRDSAEQCITRTQIHSGSDQIHTRAFNSTRAQRTPIGGPPSQSQSHPQLRSLDLCSRQMRSAALLTGGGLRKHQKSQPATAKYDADGVALDSAEDADAEAEAEAEAVANDLADLGIDQHAGGRVQAITAPNQAVPENAADEEEDDEKVQSGALGANADSHATRNPSPGLSVVSKVRKRDKATNQAFHGVASSSVSRRPRAGNTSSREAQKSPKTMPPADNVNPPQYSQLSASVSDIGMSSSTQIARQRSTSRSNPRADSSSVEQLSAALVFRSKPQTDSGHHESDLESGISCPQNSSTSSGSQSFTICKLSAVENLKKPSVPSASCDVTRKEHPLENSPCASGNGLAFPKRRDCERQRALGESHDSRQSRLTNPASRNPKNIDERAAFSAVNAADSESPLDIDSTRIAGRRDRKELRASSIANNAACLQNVSSRLVVDAPRAPFGQLDVDRQTLRVAGFSKDDEGFRSDAGDSQKSFESRDSYDSDDSRDSDGDDDGDDSGSDSSRSAQKFGASCSNTSKQTRRFLNVRTFEPSEASDSSKNGNSSSSSSCEEDCNETDSVSSDHDSDFDVGSVGCVLNRPPFTRELSQRSFTVRGRAKFPARDEKHFQASQTDKNPASKSNHMVIARAKTGDAANGTEKPTGSGENLSGPRKRPRMDLSHRRNPESVSVPLIEKWQRNSSLRLDLISCPTAVRILGRPGATILDALYELERRAPTKRGPGRPNKAALAARSEANELLCKLQQEAGLSHVNLSPSVAPKKFRGRSGGAKAKGNGEGNASGYRGARFRSNGRQTRTASLHGNYDDETSCSDDCIIARTSATRSERSQRKTRQASDSRGCQARKGKPIAARLLVRNHPTCSATFSGGRTRQPRAAETYLQSSSSSSCSTSDYSSSSSCSNESDDKGSESHGSCSNANDAGKSKGPLKTSTRISAASTSRFQRQGHGCWAPDDEPNSALKSDQQPHTQCIALRDSIPGDAQTERKSGWKTRNGAYSNRSAELHTRGSRRDDDCNAEKAPVKALPRLPRRGKAVAMTTSRARTASSRKRPFDTPDCDPNLNATDTKKLKSNRQKTVAKGKLDSRGTCDQDSAQCPEPCAVTEQYRQENETLREQLQAAQERAEVEAARASELEEMLNLGVIPDIDSLTTEINRLKTTLQEKEHDIDNKDDILKRKEEQVTDLELQKCNLEAELESTLNSLNAMTAMAPCERDSHGYDRGGVTVHTVEALSDSPSTIPSRCTGVMDGEETCEIMNDHKNDEFLSRIASLESALEEKDMALSECRESARRTEQMLRGSYRTNCDLQRKLFNLRQKMEATNPQECKQAPNA